MLRHNEAVVELDLHDGKVICADGSPFDAVAYSRFKYGYVPPAQEYARQIAERIQGRLWQVNGGHPIYIVSAPYKYLPTASHRIAEELAKILSVQAAWRGCEPPVLLPFHKARTGTSQYARSSQADRQASLATLGLHLDESLVPGSDVLVVDDIRITGSAETATAAYLEPLAPHSIWYLHYARLTDEVAARHPGLEDELNQTVAHSLYQILVDVEEGNFLLNTRVLRFILESTDEEGFIEFLLGAPTALREQLYYASIGSGREYYLRHKENIDVIEGMLVANKMSAAAVRRSLMKGECR